MEPVIEIVEEVKKPKDMTGKELKRMILEIARDHYDENYPCLEKAIEELSK